MHVCCVWQLDVPRKVYTGRRGAAKVSVTLSLESRIHSQYKAAWDENAGEVLPPVLVDEGAADEDDITVAEGNGEPVVDMSTRG